MKRVKRFYIKERDNPQLGTYYVACGQLSKAAAKRMGSSIYGSNTMLSFDTEKTYKDHLSYLREQGEKIQ